MKFRALLFAIFLIVLLAILVFGQSDAGFLDFGNRNNGQWYCKNQDGTVNPNAMTPYNVDDGIYPDAGYSEAVAWCQQNGYGW